MHPKIVATIAALSIGITAAYAQQAPVAGQGEINQPGKVSAAQVVKVSALITAINAPQRNLTLKTASGQVFDLAVDSKVKNFEQIKVGDEVVVAYLRALAMEVKKSGGVRERTDSADAKSAKPGEKPAGVVSRKVNITADVVAVDAKAKTITLKGPKGNIVELDVKNPDHFKVVKKGDQIEVEYVEALAVAVEPVAKKPAK